MNHEKPFARACGLLVKHLAEEGIRERQVLDALGRVPRHLFVNEDFAAVAYEDRPLSIGEGQTISQPWIVAFMTETLIKNKTVDKLLEIGTGSGYQTAVLAEVAQRVFTVERIPALHRRASRLLRGLGYKNIHFRCAEGSKGWGQFAPYDAIMLTAACRDDSALQHLKGQLAAAGRLLAPVGDKAQRLKMVTRTRNSFRTRELLDVKFVPLIQK